MTITAGKIKRNKENLKLLANSLIATFESIEKKRRVKELEWLSALRQVKGIYEPTVARNIPEDGSKVYPKYTKSKERYIRSKMNSIIFPENGKSWSLSPTPNPEVSEEILQEALAQLQAQQTQQITEDVINKVINKLVSKRCAKMERTIYDQLIEVKYQKVYKEVIKSGIRYGTGVWKGPITMSEKLPYTVYEDGQLIQKYKKVYYPTLKFIPIWNFYPDMSVSDFDDVSYIFELHCMTKKDLITLSKQKGFYREEILDYLSIYKDGDYTPKNWEVSLQALNDYDEVDPTDKPTIKAYQVLEYWGYVDGQYFIDAGFDPIEDNIDPSDVYEARVWLLKDRIIKLSLNPLPYGQHPYNIFFYDKDETSVFGTGLAEDIKGTQEVICATARMILDNAAIVAGPQVELNVDLLDDDQDFSSIYARKIWYRTGTGIDAQYPAVRSVNFDSHIQEYAQIIDIFRKIGDEESSLPSLLWSQLQGQETARGVSVRYQTAHVTLMDIIKEFDEAQERFLRNMYKWNLEFNDNEEIKGDFKVEAKGTDTLLQKEDVLNSIVTLFQTITEQDEPYINRKYLLRERLKALNLDAEKALNSDEEAAAILQQQQEQQQVMMQLEMERIKAETAYEKAKAANMLAKSQKTLTDDELAKKEYVKGLLDDSKREAEKFTNQIISPEGKQS